MTWSIVYSMPVDRTNDAAESAQHRAFWEYFFDTWLPQFDRWTTTTNGGSKRGCQYTCPDGFTGQDEVYGNWLNLPSGTQNPPATQVTWYEDATWTSAPGDLMNDTTNARTEPYHSPTSTFGAYPYKFWTSDENPNAWMITRWNVIIAFDWGLDWCRYKPAPHYATDTGATDQWQTHIFMGAYNGLNVSNLPNSGNTSTSEFIAYVDFPGKPYISENAFLMKNFRMTHDAAGRHTLAVCNRDDIQLYLPVESKRAGTYSWVGEQMSIVFSTGMEFAQINGEDYWWIGYGTEHESIAINVGATPPVLS